MATLGAILSFHRFSDSFPISSSPRFRPFKHQHQRLLSFHHCRVNTRHIKRHLLCFKAGHENFPSSSSPASKEADQSSRRRKLVKVFVPLILCAPLWLLVSSGAAYAAADSIRASGFGLKIASFLRGSGWADEAIVFALSTLPVIELRGAIPVGYWMEMKPLQLTVLSVLGNMVPVPIIVIYLKRFASFLAQRNTSASLLLDRIFKRAREKAGPVEEFQWLGLMLFVAVPFPGTGAWTGAIIASILDMPFWPAVTANFIGVVLAGLLVNLLVNLGLKYAVATGLGLFFVSTAMWRFLRMIKKTLHSR
ncbi:uncharacterized protein LOC116256254 [Nymphaea colorata]|nr:uncharacterized protein LOC116256254 [Nymphaea colorata]